MKYKINEKIATKFWTVKEEMIFLKWILKYQITVMFRFHWIHVEKE